VCSFILFHLSIYIIELTYPQKKVPVPRDNLYRPIVATIWSLFYYISSSQRKDMHDPIRHNVDFTDDAMDAARDSGRISEEMSTQPPRSMTSVRASGGGGGDEAEDIDEEGAGASVGIGVEDRVGDSSSGVDGVEDVCVDVRLSESSESVDDHDENRDRGSECSNTCV
jgi:hypothetical protein